MTPIRITVYGVAKPAGSKRAFALKRRDGSLVMRPNGGPVISVTDDCKDSRQWKESVASAARRVVGNMPLLDGPVSLFVRFYVVRPKSHFGAKGLRPSAPCYPTKKPDALKLLRGVEDALTKVIWHDDAANVRVTAEKVWGDVAKAEIIIRLMEEKKEVKAAPEPMELFK